MDELQIQRLVRIRHFPPVVHPQHAREVLGSPERESLADWVGGYAISVAEHRQLLEDLLGSLAWKAQGQAALIHGLYGTGKSHLLVVLHLLLALPESWPLFLDTHPIFRRYALPITQRRFLVIHFSLDEYSPRHALEETFRQEIARVLQREGIPEPAAWRDSLSRQDAWSALLAACQQRGIAGVVLLVDEMSLFLAGKSPARREADAAFLQFLAALTTRAPLWLIGALQRSFADVGALRTHSWRQVEDRFRRYALSPQEIGTVLRDKLIARTDPAAIRQVVTTRILPAVESALLPLSPGDVQMHWPFHPAAIDLLSQVTTAYLSPHRSLAEILQSLARTEWLARPAHRLLTPLDLFSLVADDLRRDERLQRLWTAVHLLEGNVPTSADPGLAQQLILLLALLHLAGRPATVTQLRALLFDGEAAPAMATLSAILHHLRRHGAYLSVLRDADPASELFSFALGDEAGALALARMQEVLQDYTPRDARVSELALQACRDAEWPFAAALAGMSLPLPWGGSERLVQISMADTLSAEIMARCYEGLLADHANGHLLFCRPGSSDAAPDWTQLADTPDDAHASTLLAIVPRRLTDTEAALWREYAAWQHAADLPDDGETTRLAERIRRHCRERAEELRPAVVLSVQALYRDGHAYGAHGELPTRGESAGMTAWLAELFAPGFTALFPLFAPCAPHGVPTRAACQQLLQHFIAPGEALLAPQSLLADYVERYAVPLGCVAMSGERARAHPPRAEILDIMHAALSDGPLRVSEAQARLAKPPLGLTPEQARLALAAALRTGVLHGLDAFLQPLAGDAGGEELAGVTFVATPPPLHEQYRAQLSTLAAQWEIPLTPWAFTIRQVEQRLRRWLPAQQSLCREARAMMTEWSELLQTLPWSWRATATLLDQLQSLSAQPDAPLMTLLDLLTPAGELFTAVIPLAEAVVWWREQQSTLRLALSLPLPQAEARRLAGIREQLLNGEEAFSQLPALGAELAGLLHAYQDAYRAWHERMFGAAVVAQLRATFQHAHFRALKLLTRLPLPLPDDATYCLAALAQARTIYCHGAFEQLPTLGCCAHCRLPFNAPAPLPDAQRILAAAEAGVQAYAALLTSHPWSEATRQRLARAPEEIALQGNRLFAWQPTQGSAVLLEILDEALLEWLCRDGQISGIRQFGQLHRRLRGRDLSLAEAQGIVHDWLDPERALPEQALLAFEE